MMHCNKISHPLPFQWRISYGRCLWNVHFAKPGGRYIVIFICVSDQHPYPTVIPFCKSCLTYSYTCLELFPKKCKSLKVHDFANYEWSLFSERKWV
jgi:hypothetical protein